MLRVGLTGGIASGKSTVAALFEQLGAHVIDSDRITHELLEPGQKVYEAVVSRFGPIILDPDGRIDRRILGKMVFEDPDLRHQLNGLMHPAVAKRQEGFLNDVARQDSDGVAIVDAALMIETGSFRRYDRIVVVSCERSQQYERLRSRGLTDEEIELRIGAQMSLEEKLPYADYVIDNSGTPDQTRRQVERVWEALRAEAETN